MGQYGAPPRDAFGVRSRNHRKGSAVADSIPASLQGLLVSFSGCFTAPSFANFVALITGWVLCQGRHCISRVIQVAGGSARSKHFATLYRFLSRARWSSDDVGRALFGLLLPFLPRDIEAIVDDTLCRHGGPRIFGVAMHHDGVLSGYGRAAKFFSCGHCWVVLAVRVPLPWDRQRGIAVPVLLRLYRSRKRCDERAYAKRTELALQMVTRAASYIPDGYRLWVTGDGEYACKTLVRDLDVAITFIGPVVMDAALYATPGRYSGKGRPRKVGRRLLSPQALAASSKVSWKKITVAVYGRSVKLLIKQQVCHWYTVAGTRRTRVVVTRDPGGRLADRAYFSTDPALDAGEILERFARRWLLEVTFRDVKQHLGLEDPQNGWSRGPRSRQTKKRPGPQPRGSRGSLAVLHTVPMAFVAYGVVVLWYLRCGRPQRDVDRARRWAPWYRHKRTVSFADMLVALRREVWAARLSSYPGSIHLAKKLSSALPDAVLAA